MWYTTNQWSIRVKITHVKRMQETKVIILKPQQKPWCFMPSLVMKSGDAGEVKQLKKKCYQQSRRNWYI